MHVCACGFLSIARFNLLTATFFRCIVNSDESQATYLDLRSKEFNDISERGMTINIHRDGSWGTYTTSSNLPKGKELYNKSRFPFYSHNEYPTDRPFYFHEYDYNTHGCYTAVAKCATLCLLCYRTHCNLHGVRSTWFTHIACPCCFTVYNIIDSCLDSQKLRVCEDLAAGP